MAKVFIIAEAGVNHNGSITAARKMVDVARRAGCDAVKFQTFKADAVVVPCAPKARYQIINSGARESQQDMLRKLELSFHEFEGLYEYCRTKGILFLSTPFDIESVDFLDSLGMKMFKIPSGEITNRPLIERIAGKHKPVILSTGMSSLHEVKTAVRWIRTAQNGKAARSGITLLHCVSEYPAMPMNVNLSAMGHMRSYFKLPVGFSDHTLGTEISAAAAALGACVIEKHFTLSRALHGPDHAASLEPQELQDMVRAVRNVEMALGDGIKKPAPCELVTRKIGRRSIVASRDIQKGERFNADNITVKRPSGGISASQWSRVIGRAAQRRFHKDERIKI